MADPITDEEALLLMPAAMALLQGVEERDRVKVEVALGADLLTARTLAVLMAELHGRHLDRNRTMAAELERVSAANRKQATENAKLAAKVRELREILDQSGARKRKRTAGRADA